MPVTYKLLDDGNLRGAPYRFFKIFADDMPLRAFTYETGETAVKRFVALAQPHCSQLQDLAKQCEDRRNWNITQLEKGGNGKNWPCFSQFEKLWKKIQREAQIQDS